MLSQNVALNTPCNGSQEIYCNKWCLY